MTYPDKGYIKLRASTASSAYPIEGAIIRIVGSEEGSIGEDYSLSTGRDGTTERIELATPSKSLSLSPNQSEQAYSTYEIYASHPGYYSIRLSNVAVFSGITSIINLDFIPNAGITRNVTEPRGSTYSVINENEELE
jgi:hypothetical protein